MSRSNPTVNNLNPSQRWYDWNGDKGRVEFYDKLAKKTIVEPIPFTFVLLDQLASITGFYERTASGIYSNEIRDVTKDVLIVKAFKGGELAKGTYQQIKDSVNSKGGKFTASLYIAYIDSGTKKLELGNLKLRGAGLNGWIEFAKDKRKEVYEQAITLDGKIEGKKGKIVFQTPTFKLTKCSEATDKTAKEIDVLLQEYLAGYFQTKKVSEQVETHALGDDVPVPQEEPTSNDFQVGDDQDGLPF